MRRDGQKQGRPRVASGQKDAAQTPAKTRGKRGGQKGGRATVGIRLHKVHIRSCADGAKIRLHRLIWLHDEQLHISSSIHNLNMHAVPGKGAQIARFSVPRPSTTHTAYARIQPRIRNFLCIAPDPRLAHATMDPEAVSIMRFRVPRCLRHLTFDSHPLSHRKEKNPKKDRA